MANEENQLLQIYNILVNLRVSGNRDYINLTSGYLTANSLLITAITILFRVKSNDSYFISFLLSFLGLVICLQMGVAQEVLRSQNAYWGRNLRILEADPEWTSYRYFQIWNQFRNWEKNPIILPGVNDEPKFKPYLGIRHHRKKWAGRMKLLPFIFGVMYIIFLIWSHILFTNNN